MENNQLKLAVVSAPYRVSLVSAHTTFPRMGFFLKGENMFQIIKCLLGFHGVTEIHHCADGHLEICRDCLKVKKVK
ncbi:hypothetical protein [Acinetobacter tianfuensis]|uniref:Uncharacterized protein n=1 Tax=Acinetobacter tianfuensis TaxID=2419603 RepID=A0A3A8EQH5_9GAMM|nr:hypothetical protein [Acinetobacter tianfuensis]RKG33000.1 hypothetical protein D7V32_04180 [Acinetobacter tianfuensis]